MKRLRNNWVLLGFVLFGASLTFAPNKTTWVAHYYNIHVYPYISLVNQGLWSWIPFSIGDIGYVLLLFLFFRYIKRLKTKKYIFVYVHSMGLLIVLFYVLWGLHYFKTPLRVERQLSDTISVEQLTATTSFYANKVRELHEELSPLSTEKVTLDTDRSTLLLYATKTMKAYEGRPPNINGKAKATLFPTLLSYMGFGGYANPFTHEAQVNTLQPKLRILTTGCHEIAHQWGYAAEDEANYIAIKASTSSSEKWVSYAGNLLAFQHLINSLHLHNKSEASHIIEKVPKGVLENIKEIQFFWKRYQNPFEQLFEKGYDSYLKANHQQAGIKSYSLVVDLLVDDFNMQHPKSKS